ncbi:class I SAM-dependent methyltransferase [Nanoarchaeota archaeon]
MDKNTKYTKDIYDTFGDKYHHFRKTVPNFFNSKIEIPATLSFIDKVKGKKIIDLGCGSGIYADLLIKKGAKVFGIDISKKLIEIAKQEVPKGKFKVANFEKLPYKKHTFDIAISALALHYVKDWNKVFKEVNRVLKKGGIFIFSTGNPVMEVRERVILNKKEYWIIRLRV